MKIFFKKMLLLAIFSAILMISGCQTGPEISPVNAMNVYELSYGEPIVFLRDGSPNLLAPLARPNAQGSFEASPAGLAINSATGEIDMSQSETGMWFTVSFKNDTNTLAETRLMISGVEYASGFYSKTGFALPYYNADPNNQMPAAQFSAKGIIIHPGNGVIDLKQSVADLAPGQSKDVTVLYRLQDQSNNAPNQIRLKLFYFQDVNDVPVELAQEIALINNPIQPMELAGRRDRPPLLIIIGK